MHSNTCSPYRQTYEEKGVILKSYTHWKEFFQLADQHNEMAKYLEDNPSSETQDIGFMIFKVARASNIY